MQICQSHLFCEACGQILPGLAQCGDMFQCGVVTLVRNYSIFNTGLSFGGDQPVDRLPQVIDPLAGESRDFYDPIAAG